MCVLRGTWFRKWKDNINPINQEKEKMINLVYIMEKQETGRGIAPPILLS